MHEMTATTLHTRGEAQQLSWRVRRASTDEVVCYTRVRTSGINLNFCSNLSNDIYVLCPYSFASHSRTKHHFAILSDKSSFIFEPKQHSRLECHRVLLDYRSCMPIQINSQLLSVSFTVSSTGLELRRKTTARCCRICSKAMSSWLYSSQS